MPDQCCTRRQFLVALVETQLKSEEIDILMQTIYEFTNEYNVVDLNVLFHHWPSKGPINITKQQNTEIRDGNN